VDATFHSDLAGTRIGILGLGYVGLPLAVEFGKRYQTLGFDINAARIAELRAGRDSSLEVEPDELCTASRLEYADAIEALADCHVLIVAVPTPINAAQAAGFRTRLNRGQPRPWARMLKSRRVRCL
jgi:UDP-N-acetyl-D-glucosamine/UDP-N-acetyl-D-galactosamine dehydrogenase